MLRGRHRGLPAAIDRAVVLPYDFNLHNEEAVPHGGLRVDEVEEVEEIKENDFAGDGGEYKGKEKEVL